LSVHHQTSEGRHIAAFVLTLSVPSVAFALWSQTVTVIDDDIQTTQGMKLSYRLHKLLQSSSAGEPIRGIRLSDSLSDNSEMSVAGILYTLVRGNRANRRYLLTTLLKMFEDDSVCCQITNSVKL